MIKKKIGSFYFLEFTFFYFWLFKGNFVNDFSRC